MKYEKLIAEETEKRRQALRDLNLFDGNIWLGRGKEFPLAPVIGGEKLAGIYKTYSVTGGLVSHWDAVNLSAQDANETLIREEHGFPDNTYSVWTALPLLPREQGPLPGYGAPTGKLGGVRIFPKTHRYECTPWVLGDLCSWCVEYNVPLIIWHVEADWNGLYGIAREFPALRLIVESQWQKILYHNRTLYNLMRHCSNVYTELSNFAGQDFLSHAVHTFGAGRFLYGSFLPMNDPFVPLGMVLDADITDEERVMIAGGNLRNIIERIQR
jgi:hypothetical protein